VKRAKGVEHGWGENRVTSRQDPTPIRSRGREPTDHWSFHWFAATESLGPDHFAIDDTRDHGTGYAVLRAFKMAKRMVLMNELLDCG
jgi:hypothetical protein